MFHKSQDQEYFEVCLSRVQNEYLAWVEQFLDLLESRSTTLRQTPRLNDLGCNMGQFWKGLKRREWPVVYRGYDVEPAYLEAFARVFPEQKNSLHQIDLNQQSSAPAEIGIMSATLEHLEDPYRTLREILSSTSDCFVLRTFLGKNEECSWFQKNTELEPYRIWQFSEKRLIDCFQSLGFVTEVMEDRATNSRPKIISETISRSQFVIFGKK